MVSVSGPSHRIVIVDDTVPNDRVEETFTIPTFMDQVVVSVSAILGGAPAEHWIAPFTPRPMEFAPVEQMQRYQAPDPQQ
jgi:hypothetical protein